MTMPIRMCPKGIETLSFALLAGYCNFGSSVAAYVSAYILSAFPALADVNGLGTDDFSDLWKVSLMSTLLPLLM